MKIYKLPEEVSVSICRYTKDSKLFTLSKDFICQVERPGFSTVEDIRVPKGFKTNLASVPRLFWPLIGPFGKWTMAAIVHDYLYDKECVNKFTRKEADLVFYEAMRYHHVNTITARVMYYMVRLFGKGSYK